MAVCWGGTWPAGKIAVEDAPPATIAADRFALATLLLWLWARRRTDGRRPGRADLPLVLAEARPRWPATTNAECRL